jgi:hypothetical protein
MRKEKIKDHVPWVRILLDEGETVRGYKALNRDWTCNGYQYKRGKEYHHDGEVRPCKSGFHFFLNVVDCYAYYPIDSIIVEVEAWGTVIQDCTKLCAESIRIVGEFGPESIKDLCKDANWNSGYKNSGHNNSGNKNSGDWNSGYGNSGNGNSGQRNSGQRNSGNRNSGCSNSGDWNSGDWNSGCSNSGDWNSGDGNSGNRNSGYGNATNWSSGVFCTEEMPVRFFDKLSGLMMEDWLNHPAKWLCDRILSGGVSVSEISDEDWATLETVPNWDREKFLLCVKALQGENATE